MGWEGCQLLCYGWGVRQHYTEIFLHLTQCFFSRRADMGEGTFIPKNNSLRTLWIGWKITVSKKELCIFDSGKLVWHTAPNALFPWRNLPLRVAKLWQNFISPYRVWQVVNNASMLLLCIVQLGSAHDAEWKGGGGEGRGRGESNKNIHVSSCRRQFIFLAGLFLSLFIFSKFPNESSVSQFP